MLTAEPVVVVVPILLESRSEPGGAVGAVKPISPPRNVTVCVAAVGFVIVTVEEKRSACAGVPGEFEFADPPCITTPSARVVEAATHGVPDAPEQMVVPLAVNNIPADAANGQSRGAVDKTAAAKNFFVILAPPGEKLQTCDYLSKTRARRSYTFRINAIEKYAYGDGGRVVKKTDTRNLPASLR